ncbi:MAG: hypothetical protein GPJ54_04590 [Candidatus Heimdallarchaeota archaeon]|nr:hypothetical protein [Candidatus Heimdallarchaeota archaeon]
MNIILDTKSKIYKKSIHEVEKVKLEGSFGFALKLSILQKYGISVEDILEQSYQEIVIDAEFDRLDHWVDQQLQLENLKEEDLKRLHITVQAKRYDAEEQLQYFEDRKISVVLVAGHQDYLRQEEKKRSGIKLIAKFYQKYTSITYLGISSNTHEKLNKILNYRIKDRIVLELYGEHKLNQSSLWVYWAGSELSNEARSYIDRRRQNGQELSYVQVLSLYFIQDHFKIATYTQNRTLFVYLDVFNKDEFFKNMKDFDKSK